MSGYSGTPVVSKLGIKSGHRLYLVNAPEVFLKLFRNLPDDVGGAQMDELTPARHGVFAADFEQSWLQGWPQRAVQ